MTTEFAKKVAEMYRSGRPVAEILEEMRIHPYVLYYALQVAGVPLRYRKGRKNERTGDLNG